MMNLNTSKRSRKPIFVMGCPKSGTTYTKGLLGQLKGYRHIQRESQIFPLALGALLRSPRRKIQIPKFRQDFMEKVYHRQAKGIYGDVGLCTVVRERKLKVYLDEYLTKIADSKFPYELTRKFMDSIFMKDEFESFVEKTPHNIFYVDLINKIYPDCVIVIPTRPYQDVVNSMMQADWFPNDLQDVESYVGACMAEVLTIGTENVIKIEFDQPNFVYNLISSLRKKDVFVENADDLIKYHQDEYSVDVERRHEKSKSIHPDSNEEQSSQT